MKNGFLNALLLGLFIFMTIPAFAATADPEKTSGAKQEEEIPLEYFEEADGYLRSCQNNNNMRQYYNCDCLAAEFLQQRIKYPKQSQQGITLSIQNKCVDATEAAGYEYQRCMSNSPLLPSDKDPNEYCSCFSNAYAKSFEMFKSSVNSKIVVELQTRAHITCTNPALAKKLFPYEPGG